MVRNDHASQSVHIAVVLNLFKLLSNFSLVIIKHAKFIYRFLDNMPGYFCRCLYSLYQANQPVRQAFQE